MLSLLFQNAYASSSPVASAVAQAIVDSEIGFEPPPGSSRRQEMVGVSHGNLARVRELVEREPALARAAIDWGFGDWERPWGGRAHRPAGNCRAAAGERRPAHALPAAMLGQLDVVRAFIQARPGTQRIDGPDGIRCWRTPAPAARTPSAVVADLERSETPTPAPDPTARRRRPRRRRRPLPVRDGPRDHFDVDVEQDQLGIGRLEATRRNLLHTGDLVFFPAGVPMVKIAFARESGQVSRLTWPTSASS